MTSGDALRDVAQLVEALDGVGATVEDVTVVEDANGPVAELAVRLPDGSRPFRGLSAAAARASAAGGRTQSPGETGGTDRTTAPDASRDRPAEAGDPTEDGSAGRAGPPAEGGSADDGGPDATVGQAEESPDDRSGESVVHSDAPDPETTDGGTRDAAVDGDGVAGRSSGATSDPDATADSAPDPSPDDADPDETAGADDGAVVCRVEGCDRTFETTHGMKIHAAKAHRPDEDGGAGPHRDPDRLRAVYEEHDTFAEMRDALAADVTAQTVRRNMMKFGIHEPDDRPAAEHAAAAAATDPDPPQPDADGSTEPESDGGEDGRTTDEADLEDDDGRASDEMGLEDDDDQATGETRQKDDDGNVESEPTDDGDGESDDVAGAVDVALPESASLPAGLDVDAIAAAASGARTLFEFQRALDVDRETAKRLVEDFDLTAFVTGRLDDGRSETGSERDVVRHIAETVGGRSGGERGDGSGASAD